MCRANLAWLPYRDKATKPLTDVFHLLSETRSTSSKHLADYYTDGMKGLQYSLCLLLLCSCKAALFFCYTSPLNHPYVISQMSFLVQLITFCIFFESWVGTCMCLFFLHPCKVVLFLSHSFFFGQVTLRETGCVKNAKWNVIRRMLIHIWWEPPKCETDRESKISNLSENKRHYFTSVQKLVNALLCANSRACDLVSPYFDHCHAAATDRQNCSQWMHQILFPW